MAVSRCFCSISVPLFTREERSCAKRDLDPQQVSPRLAASWILLTFALLSIHVGVGAITSFDDGAGPSFELGLEPSPTALGRRLLAVNLTQSMVEDGEVLLRIKATILSDPFNVTYWWKRSGAKKSLNPCKVKNFTAQYWPGIDCTNKRVTAVNLSSMSLTGTLSPYLGALTFLKSVDLSNNSFTGPIPDDLTSATHLETLNLADNLFNGSLPASIGNWTNLTSLNVANNLLVGQIPASIGSLQLLETLNMTGNNFTGAIPQELSRCGRLTEMDLSRNGLQGIVPFQNLTNLTVLHLQENQLEGNFVTHLGTLFRLKDLDLSRNYLTGAIPATISNLPLQNQLSLAYNNLTGEIPDALGELSLVLQIDLSCNFLVGAIPHTVGRCLSLQKLNISHNVLQGNIPTTLAVLPSLVIFDASENHIDGSLPSFAGVKSLRVFDASFNNLDGRIPRDFVDFDALQYLNVSYNNLQGEVPFFKPHDNVNRMSFMKNHLCGKAIGLRCEPRSDDNKATVIAIAVGSSVAFLVLFAIVYILCSRHYEEQRQLKKFATVSGELTGKFTPELVLIATQNFNRRNKIGDGSMSTVYRGVLSSDTEVAVKKLAIQRGDLEKVLGDGFETLAHVRHWSLVKVLGYCCSPDVTALVMEYMPNGTLSNVMYPNRDQELVRDFNWNQRFNAAIGVAEGLKYLHHECPIPAVHGDLKPTNILFNAFMEARIADFGVAKLLADHGLGPGHTLEAGHDNIYKAPESADMAGLTMKSDVYSFGVIVLEMISGRSSPPPEASGQSMPKWIRNSLTDPKTLPNILDSNLLSELKSNEQKMLKVLGVALLCTRDNPQERPYISEVLKMLSHIKSKPEGDQEKSSPQLRSSPSAHQRSEEIRQELPGLGILPSPPITPPGNTPAPQLFPPHPTDPSNSSPPQPTMPHSLPPSTSLSEWAPSPENR